MPTPRLKRRQCSRRRRGASGAPPFFFAIRRPASAGQGSSAPDPMKIALVTRGRLDTNFKKLGEDGWTLVRLRMGNAAPENFESLSETLSTLIAKVTVQAMKGGMPSADRIARRTAALRGYRRSRLAVFRDSGDPTSVMAYFSKRAASRARSDSPRERHCEKLDHEHSKLARWLSDRSFHWSSRFSTTCRGNQPRHARTAAGR